MAKKSRNRTQPTATAPGEVGPRQPCPCGSGKRYKACHGAAGGAAPTFVARPFEGMPDECDVIALRELVPAATAPLTLKSGDRAVRLATLLPGAAPAMVRESGDVWLGLQVQHSYGNPARDLGAVLEAALATEEPGIVGLPSAPGEGPSLQDLISDTSLDITVHDGFEYWIDDIPDRDASMEAALEQANGGVMPTSRLTSVEAAYWTNVGTKEHLRWVMPSPRTSYSTPWPACTRPDRTRWPTDRGSSACSAPTACSPRCGTSRWRPVRTCSRTRPHGSPPTSRRRCRAGS